MHTETLALPVERLRKETEVEGEGVEKDIVVVLEVLEHRVGVELANLFVLIEIVDIERYLHQAIVLLVEQLFDKVDVSFEV